MGRSFQKWIWQAILFTIFTAGIFLLLNWLQINIGAVTLLVSGVAIYWVLSGITILPWNIYFVADETLEEMRKTEEKGGKCNPQDKEYSQKARRKSGVLAVFLHCLTATLFLLLAIFTDLGMICYLAAGAALGLTILRPAMHSVEHILSRLKNIQETVRFPRDDVYELKNRLSQLEYYDQTAKDLQKTFDERYQQLQKAYDEKCEGLQSNWEKNSNRVKDLEQIILRVQREITTKIDTFDDAVAFKTAWERVAPELGKIFRASGN